jgi:hypothetical protein
MPDFGDDRVMGCDAKDLERWLGDLTGQAGLHFAKGRLDLIDQGVAMTILIDPMPPRRLGLIQFRDTRVRFQYPPAQADQARHWIKAFDRFTQRGGG